MTVAITKVETKLNDIVLPIIPGRPCSQFEDHIDAHKSTLESWRKPLFIGIICTFFMFVQEPIKQIFTKFFK